MISLHWSGVFTLPELFGSPSKAFEQMSEPHCGAVTIYFKKKQNKNKTKTQTNPDKCSAKMSGPGITGAVKNYAGK